MSQLKRNFDKSLAKFTIPEERYHKEYSQLLLAGFTQDQADKLIIRQSSSNTVQTVLNRCNTLLSVPYQLNHEQIVTIAVHNGGAKNIEAIHHFFDVLTTLGFTIEHTNRVRP